jgi:sulfur relay protein TusB/DsrH
MSKFTLGEDQVSIVRLASQLAKKGEEVSFLHIQEACKATTSAGYSSKLLEAGIRVYALKADVEAQKLTKKMQPDVELVDYKQWVSLLMDKHDKIVSWTS